MKWGTEIKSLKDEDLPKYKNFLLDLILEKEKKEAFRQKVLDRYDLVDIEIKEREKND